MASTGTLLSDLHDDLLRHILSFAPAHRPVLASMALALAHLGPSTATAPSSSAAPRWRSPPRMTTPPSCASASTWPTTLAHAPPSIDVLYLSAARRVEELRVTAPCYFWLGALPFATHRALHVAGCPDIAPAPHGVVFSSRN